METITRTSQTRTSREALSSEATMVVSVVLAVVLVLILCFHLYARWYALRRSGLRFVFFFIPTSGRNHPRGPDPEALRSIPIVTRSASESAAECAVCLSDIAEGEKARVLPRCLHVFHAECVDMWFFSHATCPLCRSVVAPASTSCATIPRA